MKIAYAVTPDDREMAQAHARALAARGHDVQLIDGPADGFDLVVGRDVALDRIFTIGRIIDDEFFRTKNPAENEPMRVLLAGASQSEAKGVGEGYGAAAHARWFHQKFDLIRASPWAPSREEPLDDVQEFHVALDTHEMRRLIHTCDVFIGPGHADAAFDFATAAAMAAGVPAVLTSTPVNLSFDAVPDYALFAPAENAIELGEKLIEILGDYELRDRLRVRERTVAEQWRAERVIDRLEAFFVEQLAARQR